MKLLHNCQFCSYHKLIKLCNSQFGPQEVAGITMGDDQVIKQKPCLLDDISLTKSLPIIFCKGFPAFFFFFQRFLFLTFPKRSYASCCIYFCTFYGSTSFKDNQAVPQDDKTALTILHSCKIFFCVTMIFSPQLHRENYLMMNNSQTGAKFFD